MPRLVLRAIILLSTVGLGVAVAQAPRQSSAQVDYDTFMKGTVQERIRLFNEVSAEYRAALVRTHIERWLEQNEARLTQEQIQLMHENLEFVTPDAYRTSRPPELLERAKALEQRTAAVFSREDMLQALTIRGDYIPQKTKK
jgi:hypothetical protein